MFDEAITYAERPALHALVIDVEGEVVVAQAGGDRELDAPHALYSGTKSFWGIAACAAAQDRLLDLDEPIGDTISEWPLDWPARAVTIRQLLNLTSGYGFGGLGNAVPTAARALAIPPKNAPGTIFTYGGIPLQVFGEVLRRKVAPRFESAHAYLEARILEPIGLRVDDWRRLSDGSRPLPTGAFMRAGEWLKFGRFLLAEGAGTLDASSFAACTTGSAANPNYGLGLWLAHRDGKLVSFYASGAGGQGLYILPQRGIVAVRFGQSSSWNHAAFVKRLSAD
jgi:CubicO group peptidase (beta-lactamase class C family)